MKIRGSGFKQATDRLKRFGRSYRKHQIRAVQDVSIKIVGTAKTLVPIISGNLKRSINFDHPEQRGNKIVGKVGSGALYSKYVEYGKDRYSVPFAGRYFLRKAISKEQAYFRKRMAQVLKDAIVKA